MVDGEPADYEKVGKDLVVSHPVTADQRYDLEIFYAGTPEPVEVPVKRRDFDHTGWTITPDGETWTMQEPFGAFTWYAVNDQPADKALYDFTLTVPAPWTGVANGELLDVSDEDGLRTSRWQLDEPAASYLVTTAFGDFDHDARRVRERGADHLLDAARRPRHARRAAGHPDAMAWLETPARPLPLRHLRHAGGRLAERHGDPDHGHPRATRATPCRRRSSCTSSRTSGTATR